MPTVQSADGTTIAFDQLGAGPPIILIDGALSYPDLAAPGPLAELLAERFTVIVYQRRGRGQSGDTPPYAVAREIEDIDALIAQAGGAAGLYGMSSGAALALEAALRLGPRVTRLAMYEAPYDDDPAAQDSCRAYLRELTALLAAGRHAAAVACFLSSVGMDAEAVAQLLETPTGARMAGIAPTLAYDHTALLGPDGAVPRDRAARLAIPTLVLAGSETYPFMQATAQTLAQAMPNAEHRVLAGQTHEVAAEALAPVLAAFFAASAAT